MGETRIEVRESGTEDNHDVTRHPFTIKVNDTAVQLTEHRRDGAQIKAAAIAAGVPVQADFVLSRVLPDGKQQVIPDDKEIELHEGEEFWAIPGDDNS